MEAEWTYFGGCMDGISSGKTRRDKKNVTDLTGVILGGAHAISRSPDAQRGNPRGSRHKRSRRAVDITTLTPFLIFGCDVLIDRVNSL